MKDFEYMYYTYIVWNIFSFWNIPQWICIETLKVKETYFMEIDNV